MRKLTQAHRTLVERARNPGSSDMGVRLADADCSFLVATIARDLHATSLFPDIDFACVPSFFEAPPDSGAVDVGIPFRPAVSTLFEHVQDADTYFSCLAALLRSRFKYQQILRRQPFPTVDQVGPRGLIQFGTLMPRNLLGLLYWRKWFYDLDNRSAQDTGYLFEPIVANAIGGTPVGSRRSPVKRHGSPNKGRQVDCIHDGRAYEIKIRVTIAASGQGRWQEELSFPRDCASSEFEPVLVVLDPTPNPKLSELCAAFLDEGGQVFVGEDAWNHLREEAGPSMSQFLGTYVRAPLDALLAEADHALPDLVASICPEGVRLGIGNEFLVIPRAPSAAEDPGPEIPDDVDVNLPGV